MSVIVNQLPQTKVNCYYGVNFSCDVKLSDTEQIIIEVPDTEYNYTLGGYRKTGSTTKYRLEKISYDTPHTHSNQIVLRHLTVRGFRKDGGLRFRETTLWHLTEEMLKEVIAQIPDKYHDYAREEFAIKMAELQERLTELTNNGVKIV
jgi:hypothetical protein